MRGVCNPFLPPLLCSLADILVGPHLSQSLTFVMATRLWSHCPLPFVLSGSEGRMTPSLTFVWVLHHPLMFLSTLPTPM